MKTRLKCKTDLKRTGNKSIKLVDWEKSMLKAMEGEKNPTIGIIPGALQIDCNAIASSRGKIARSKCSVERK